MKKILKAVSILLAIALLHSACTVTSKTGDTITSYLPYFGRAYAAPYSGGNVFSFNAPVLKYSVDFRKKGVVKVMVSTKTIDDNFTFYIELYENNKVSVRVNTVNRQGISYLGELTD